MKNEIVFCVQREDRLLYTVSQKTLMRHSWTFKFLKVVRQQIWGEVANSNSGFFRLLRVKIHGEIIIKIGRNLSAELS